MSAISEWGNIKEEGTVHHKTRDPNQCFKLKIKVPNIKSLRHNAHPTLC